MPMSLEKWRDRHGDAFPHIMKYRKKHGRLPWKKAYDNIVGRCIRGTDPKWMNYGGRGIKCLIKISDLKNLYIAQKAWLLNHASIDRIDSNGHYEVGNIRWIEMDENRRSRKYARPTS